MTPIDPATLRPGNVDIHSHLLPAQCYRIPTADGSVDVTDVAGELHLGCTPIAVSGPQLSDVSLLLRDMDEHDIGVRVVSAPPYAFAVGADAARAAEYATQFNERLLDLVAPYPDRLLPLGIVPVQDAEATAAEAQRLAAAGVAGIAVPPVVGAAALGDHALRHVLHSAAAADLCVLVHPMQQPRPGFAAHYLQNLIGNPVESACAIASIALGGVYDIHPDLRIAFVHGAGAAPALLGRWDHGWRERDDVSADCATAPSEVVRSHVYADSLTHSDAAADLLQAVLHPDRLLLGSDYPFDMADPDPVGSAKNRAFDLGRLRANAFRWLGLPNGPAGEDVA